MFKWLKEFFSDKEHNDIKTEYDEFVKKQNEELEKNCVSSDYFHFLLNRISNYDLFEIEYSYGDYEINEIEDKRGVHIYYSPTCYYKPRVTVFINANRIILNDRQVEIVFNNIKSLSSTEMPISSFNSLFAPSILFSPDCTSPPVGSHIFPSFLVVFLLVSNISLFEFIIQHCIANMYS